MSLVGLVQLAQAIFNQNLDENSLGPQTTTKNQSANETANGPQTNADSFVPSAQNPVLDAGTFQVQQVSLFTPAATILLGQNSAQTPAATLTDLSNLNASLTVRGLTPSEIAAIDRVARLIKDSNPTAFSDLINQYQSLVQPTALQHARNRQRKRQLSRRPRWLRNPRRLNAMFSPSIAARNSLIDFVFPFSAAISTS